MRTKEEIKKKLNNKQKMLDTVEIDESDLVGAIMEEEHYDKHKLIARTLEWVLEERDYRNIKSGIIG